MIDFSSLPTKKKAYGGKNGSKLSVVYQGELYMLKLPSHSTKNPKLSYANSTVSEYLGCHIFNLLGIKAQETLLGTYDHHGKTLIAVACKDFTSFDTCILDFASVKNQVVECSSNGYGVQLEDVLFAIRHQFVTEKKELEAYFWDMFVVDAFIGNWDRHNGNWGFLYSQEKDELELAPIFDCGSSLFPQVDEEMMETILGSKKERNMRVYEVPSSSLMIGTHRINYYKLITSLEYSGCNEALKRIVPRIHLDEINALIDQTEPLSETAKRFLKTMLRLRKEMILDVAYKKLRKEVVS